MNLRNCDRCGKVYAAVSSKNICPQCYKKEDEKFNLVKDYLRENPKAKIEEVHKATSVEIDTILKFIRDNRLLAKNVSNISLKCDSCGIAIMEGRFCKSCQQRLIKGLQSKQKKDNQKVEKMYFSEKKKKT